jgi:hypothetical protein
VAPGSELGLRTVYVKGMVMMPTTVRTKKGKNCPYNLLDHSQKHAEGIHTWSSYE